MPIPITALYAGLLALFGIYLAYGAGSLRGKTGISVGDGGNKELLTAMRKHGNWAEFTPIALILLGVLELNGVGALWLHIFGGVFLVTRICHAFGLEPDSIQNPLRAVGAGGGTLVVVVMAVWAIVLFF